jgi:hypothetical protein
MAGSALDAVARDARGRFLKGAIGNPQGWQRSKRVALLHRALVRDYGGASRVTVAGRTLLGQVARLTIQAERERDPTIAARLCNSISRLLAKVEVIGSYPEPSRKVYETPWWQAAQQKKVDVT